ncbi:MAG: stage V sporulation protein AC [bacterium]|jgi:stage V sporulation protein AC
MSVQGQSPTQQEYQRRVKQTKPKPPVIRNVTVAFVIGGFICIIGQAVINFFMSKGLSFKDSASPTAAVMVTLGSSLTGLGWYDELGKFAGAGSAVPITGFANSIVSPALEFKREGFVLGVGARLFAVAGPVLAYGTLTSVVIGLIFWLIQSKVVGVIQI